MRKGHTQSKDLRDIEPVEWTFYPIFIKDGVYYEHSWSTREPYELNFSEYLKYNG